MPKPVCVDCGMFFKPSKTGRYWTENKPIGNSAPPGKNYAGLWEFYKVWSGDEYTCAGCGARIIVGHGQNPIAEDYKPGAIEMQKALQADRIVVNDC
jgi:hypothetical protein